MTNAWRYRLTALGVVAASACIVLWFASRYASTYARRELETQLQQVFEGPVSVGGVDLGWRQVVATHIVATDDSAGATWIEVGELVADVGIWDAIKGTTTPDRVVVSGCTLKLRFDSDGNLLTPVLDPTFGDDTPVESILMRNGSIVVEQEGRDSLLVSQIDGQLDTNTLGFDANGTIGDALGSVWQFDATSEGAINATVSTPRLQLAGDRLQQLLKMPAACAGIERITSSVEIQLLMNKLENGDLTQRLEINFGSLNANVPAAEVSLEQGSAEVVIENQQLHLKRLEGSILGGTVSLAGEFDLAETSGSMNCGINGMSLAGLPASWQVPKRLTGQLSGDVTAQIDSSGNEVFFAGTARGAINDARVAGLGVEPVEIEIELDRQPIGQEPTGDLRVGMAVSRLDLNALLTKLDSETKELKERPTGFLTGTLQMSVPLEAINDPQQYAGIGNLNSPEVTAGQVTVSNLASDIVIKQGLVSLEQIHCRFADGSFQGRLTADMVTGDVDANLELEAVSINALSQLAGAGLNEVAGRLGSNVGLHGSWKDLISLDAWTANGQINSKQVEIHDDVLTDAVATVQLSNGLLRLSDLRVGWSEAAVTGDATLDLHSPQTFAARVATGKIAIESLVQRIGELSELTSLEGSVGLNANLNGTLMPLEWKADGDASFETVTLQSWKIDKGKLRWRLGNNNFHVSQLDMKAYGGELNAIASIPISAGSIDAKGSFTDIDTDLLPIPPNSPFVLSGKAAGSFSLSTPKPDGNVLARVEFNGPNVTAHTVEVSNLVGNALYNDGEMQLDINGQVLDGTMSINGSGTVNESDLSDITFDGKIYAERIDLSALSSLSKDRQVQQLQGKGIADIDFRIAGLAVQPTGSGTLSVERLRWKNIDLASSASAKISLQDNSVLVKDVLANMSEGTASGEAIIPLTAGRSGTFRLNLERVRSRRLLALWPELADQIDGILDLRLEGRVDRTFHGAGQFRMSRAQVAGIPIQRMHAPIHWTFSPEQNRFQVNSHDATTHVGHGRLTTDLQLTVGRSMDIKCIGKAHSIDIKTLLRKAPGASRSVDGSLSADFSIEGRDVRSANDLTGRYKAKVVQSQTMLLPVFQDLAGALGLGSLTRTFDITESKGRLTRGGVIRVDELHIANSDIQMDIEGRVLLNGRIDLDVTAHAGEFAATSLLGQLLRSPLRLVQPVGIGLLIQANDFFERRLLFFKIGGTFRHPTVRPRANEFLQQEAILYFLDQASSQLLR